MSPDERSQQLRTQEVEKLGVLAELVRLLREDLTAYRWTLDRYLKRGAVGLAILLLLLVSVLVSTIAVVQTARANDELLARLVEAEQVVREDSSQHRLRNEELHSCLVELVYAVVTTPPAERQAIPNPCPDPIDLRR